MGADNAKSTRATETRRSLGRHESHQQQLKRDGSRRLQRSSSSRGSGAQGSAPLQRAQLAAAVFVAVGLLVCVYIVLLMLVRRPEAGTAPLGNRLDN